MPYDRILLPTDGSPESEQVLEHAEALARTHEAEIHVVYVVDTTSYASFPEDAAWEGISDMLYQEGSEAIESAKERLESADITVTTALEEGSPAKRIIAYATEHDCDLIVMGTHGRGGLDRLLLGSVAERVVRKSPIPVMTVRVET